MRLVLDTNILIAALIKDSLSREILFLPGFDFLLPEYALEEVNRHRTFHDRLLCAGSISLPLFEKRHFSE